MHHQQGTAANRAGPQKLPYKLSHIAHSTQKQNTNTRPIWQRLDYGVTISLESAKQYQASVTFSGKA
jgi:hypothetical protein